MKVDAVLGFVEADDRGGDRMGIWESSGLE